MDRMLVLPAADPGFISVILYVPQSLLKEKNPVCRAGVTSENHPGVALNQNKKLKTHSYLSCKKFKKIKTLY